MKIYTCTCRECFKEVKTNGETIATNINSYVRLTTSDLDKTSVKKCISTLF